MGVAFVCVLAVPALQHFFALRLVGTAMPWLAVGTAAVAAIVLEFLWKRAGRHFPV
jgi:cation-transporting ATPase E